MRAPRGVGSLRRRMGLHQANGARLGRLLLPRERPENATRLDGGEEFGRLALHLEEIWGV